MRVTKSHSLGPFISERFIYCMELYCFIFEKRDFTMAHISKILYMQNETEIPIFYLWSLYYDRIPHRLFFSKYSLFILCRGQIFLFESFIRRLAFIMKKKYNL